MNVKLIKEKFNAAVFNFLQEDPCLLKIGDGGVHEQAISHRIAVYLDLEFKGLGYHVDCEYNKHEDLPKRLRLDQVLCQCPSCMQQSNISAECPLFRPDINVHHRNDDTRNLLVVEIKKTQKCLKDCAKLKKLSAPLNQNGYGYQLGIFLYFEVKNHEYIPQYIFFRDGKKRG